MSVRKEGKRRENISEICNVGDVYKTKWLMLLCNLMEINCDNCNIV